MLSYWLWNVDQISSSLHDTRLFCQKQAKKMVENWSCLLNERQNKCSCNNYNHWNRSTELATHKSLQHFSVDVESRIPVSSKLLANVDISCYERHTFAAYATKTHRHHPKLFVDIYCLHSICAFAKCGVRTKNTSILMAFGFSLLFFSLSNFHYKFNLYE